MYCSFNYIICQKPLSRETYSYLIHTGEQVKSEALTHGPTSGRLTMVGFELMISSTHLDEYNSMISCITL